MNIYTQTCGLVLIILVIMFFSRYKKMGVKSEKFFASLMYATLTAVCLDIISCLTIVYSDYFPRVLVIFIAKFYLVALFGIVFWGVMYASCRARVIAKKKRHEFLLKAYNVIMLLGDILIFALPLDFKYDGNILYTYGPSALITYAACIFFMLCIFYEVFVNGQTMTPKEKTTVLMWVGIWLGSAIIQYFNPQLLVVSFGGCLGTLVVFLELENPESVIDKSTGFFSANLIESFFDNFYIEGKPFSILRVSFDPATNDQTRELRDITVLKLAKKCESIDNASIFVTTEKDFIIVFENDDFIESTKYEILKYLEGITIRDVIGDITLLRPVFISIADAHIVNNSTELCSILFNYAAESIVDVDGVREMEINLEDVKRFRNKKMVEDLLVEAIKNDRVEVFFQPIYNVASKAFTSAEALVRIRKEDGSLVFPDLFIPVAEDTGRIAALSEIIYKKAMIFFKENNLDELGVDYIELNLSVKQGEEPDFANKFIDISKECGISSLRINLEITETASLQKKETMISNMTKLIENGFSFSLDDFGSGSSNIDYIIDMPVSIIKFDRLLTRSYFESPKAKAAILNIAKMAHDMNLSIVAEGIEDKEMLDALIDVGVDNIQGYYFSKPISKEDYLAFIKEKNASYIKELANA